MSLKCFYLLLLMTATAARAVVPGVQQNKAAGLPQIRGAYALSVEKGCRKYRHMMPQGSSMPGKHCNSCGANTAGLCRRG